MCRSIDDIKHLGKRFAQRRLKRPASHLLGHGIEVSQITLEVRGQDGITDGVKGDQSTFLFHKQSFISGTQNEHGHFALGNILNRLHPPMQSQPIKYGCAADPRPHDALVVLQKPILCLEGFQAFRGGIPFGEHTLAIFRMDRRTPARAQGLLQRQTRNGVIGGVGIDAITLRIGIKDAEYDSSGELHIIIASNGERYEFSRDTLEQFQKAGLTKLGIRIQKI